jgi:hypothetical protein
MSIVLGLLFNPFELLHVCRSIAIGVADRVRPSSRE